MTACADPSWIGWLHEMRRGGGYESSKVAQKSLDQGGIVLDNGQRCMECGNVREKIGGRIEIGACCLKVANICCVDKVRGFG